MKADRCKGMRDLLPQDMGRFRYVEEVFRDCSSKWGYDEIRTPTLEYLHLFTATGTLTPSTLRRVYTFLDWDGWSGERVVLRPDGTIPAARLFSENQKQLGNGICRLSYVGNTFTFEETEKGRRERWQCGAELIGISQPPADAELVLLATEILNTLGFNNLEVKLSHAGLIKALIGEIGIDSDAQTQIFDQVLDGDMKALAGLETKNADLKRALSLLLSVKGDSLSFLDNFRTLSGGALPKFEPSLCDLTDIAGLLSKMDCPYKIDIASGRGFEYYTGAMFQFYIGKKWVGGGGRYNDLISLVGGPKVAASGFAIYVDKLMDLLKLKGRPAAKILIKSQNDDAEALKLCFDLASYLRQTGCPAALHQGQEAATGYRWLVSISKDGRYQLIDQETGSKRELTSKVAIRKVMEGSQ